MSQMEIIKAAVDAGYKAVCAELEKHGLKYDAQSCDDCIFVDDTEQKKTFSINVFERECAEYEGN